MPYKNRLSHVIIGVVSAILTLMNCSANDLQAQPQSTIITLDQDIHYQTISGWEATAQLSDKPHRPEWVNYNEALMDKAVYDLGLNRIRLEIRAGAEDNSGAVSRFISGALTYEDWKDTRYQTVNDNDDPTDINWDGFDFAELDWHIDNTIIPMQERLQTRDEQLLVNLCYVAFRTGPYLHKNPEEYAEFVLATYLHMQEKYGFVPDTWEVILEPDLKLDMWSGKMIGRAIVSTARRLQENGFTPAFVVPSVTNMQNASPYLRQIAAVPGAIEHVVEFSYHRYGWNKRRTLIRMAELGQEYNIHTSMLEWWFGDATYEVLHEDLKSGQVAAWQGRALQGHFDVYNPDSETPGVQPRQDVRYNLQYFRDVRSGAVRIEALSSNEDWMDPLAFINPDNSTTVVIKANGSGEVVLNGLPDGLYQISYAIEQGSNTLPERIAITANESLRTNMPAAGVLTISAH